MADTSLPGTAADPGTIARDIGVTVTTTGTDRTEDATVLPSRKVWTTLITNTAYLSGLLLLDYTLKEVGSQYPLLVLYSDTFPADGHAALDRRGIAKKRIDYLLPSVSRDYSQDPRFYDCWSKLAPFSLVEYERVVQLDSDMFLLQNMDELMDLELDPASLGGTGDRVFAAGHACVCNPLRKPHYPADWVPANCAFTALHGDPDGAQEHGASNTASLGMPNGGLQVVNPSAAVYSRIVAKLDDPAAVASYDFADQSMLSDLFYGRWVPLPYIYNALKTLRWPGVHDAIWRDGRVKNVHLILSPKAWDEAEGTSSEATSLWWWQANRRRLDEEKARGIVDGF